MSKAEDKYFHGRCIRTKLVKHWPKKNFTSDGRWVYKKGSDVPVGEIDDSVLTKESIDVLRERDEIDNKDTVENKAAENAAADQQPEEVEPEEKQEPVEETAPAEESVAETQPAAEAEEEEAEKTETVKKEETMSNENKTNTANQSTNAKEETMTAKTQQTTSTASNTPKIVPMSKLSFGLRLTCYIVLVIATIALLGYVGGYAFTYATTVGFSEVVVRMIIIAIAMIVGLIAYFVANVAEHKVLSLMARYTAGKRSPETIAATAAARV